MSEISILRVLEGVQQIGNKTGILDFSPEFFHKLAMVSSNIFERMEWILENIGKETEIENSEEVEIGPITLKNPVGLAAGFLKQSHGLKFWEAFGFGYMTIGGITRDAQPGNYEPRIFRFSKEKSIVNGMGLPGDGYENEADRLGLRKINGMMPKIPIIANLSNSARTSEQYKILEFKQLMGKLFTTVDGFEINVSCPNQGGIVDMQKEVFLKSLLNDLKEYNNDLARIYGVKRKALIVKISPLTKYEVDKESEKLAPGAYFNIAQTSKIKDLSLEGLELIAKVCNEVGIDAVTATNTSQEHDFGTKIKKQNGDEISGGLSGLGLHEQSLRTVRKLRESLNDKIKIIGVGGIGYDNGESGIEMIKAGADSVQVLSSFVQSSIMSPIKLLRAISEAKKSGQI